LRRYRIGLVVAAVVLSIFPSSPAVHAATSPPGAPTGVSAAAGTLSATVSWTPSGAPADSFSVVSSPGGISATVAGSATTAAVTGLGFLIAYTFSVTGTNTSGAGAASAASNPISPLAPGGPYHQGLQVPLLNTTISAGHPLATNFGDDPVHLPGIKAVVVNVTASQASTATSVQLVVNQQVVQAIAVAPGQVESNLAVIDTPPQLTQAAIQVVSGAVRVEVDFVGYFTGPASVHDHSGLLQMIHTATLLNSTIAAGAATDIPVLGQGDVPTAHVAAVLLNVTAINAAGAGSFALRPSGTFATPITTLGFAAGQTTANRALVAMPSTSGAVTLLDRGAAAGVRVDVLGWFSDGTDASAIGSLFSSVASTRVVDSAAQGGPIPAGSSLNFAVWGQGSVPPATATAPPTSVLAQITAIAPAGAGSIAIAGTSAVDFAAGQTVTGIDLVHLAGDGSASLTVLGAATDVTVDVVAALEGDMIVPGSTKVLGANLLAAITNLGSDLTITFAAGTQVSPPIMLNDVIVAGVSPTTPKGFLRRVLSITTNSSGQTVIGTRRAIIPEAVTAFSIEWALPPKSAFGMSRGAATATLAAPVPLRTTSPFPPPLGTSIDPNYPSFFIAKPPVSRIVDLSTIGLGQSELDINDLEVQALPNFKATGNPFLGQPIHLNVGFSVAARAAIRLQILASVNLINQVIFELPDPIHIFGPVDVQIGPVPVPVDLDLDLKVTFTLRINGGVAFGYNVDRYGAVSGGYDGSNFFVDQPVYKDYLTPQQTVTIEPDVQEQAEFDVHVIPILAFYEGVGTIGVDVQPFLRVTVAPLSTPWWDVSAGICRSLVIGTIFTSSTFQTPLACVELELLHAPGARLNITLSPTSTTVARSGTAHFRAGIAGTSTNGVTWSVKGGSANGTLSNATQTDVDYTAPRTASKYLLTATAIDDPTSTATAVITVPADPPSPPQNVSAALASSTSASVGWSPPADNGGAAITGYTLSASPSVTTVNVNAPNTATTIFGLTPNTTYTFTVTATNTAALTSVPSAASPPITTPPAGPMSITPTALDFGAIAFGQSSQPKTVTITAGGTQLAVTSIVLTGAQAGNFAISSNLCSGRTLDPGASCTFTVVYTPTIQGPVSASVTVTDTDATPTQTVTLAGSSPVPTTPGVQRIADLQMIDLTHGFLVDSNGIMATVDGGTTWVRQKTPADVQFFSGQLGLRAPGSLRFVDASHGWALACQTTSTPCTPLVIGTSDAGQTWQDLGTLPANMTMTQVWFTDLQHGWVIGWTPGTPVTGYPYPTGANALFATADGGLTWNAQALPDALAGPSCPVLDEGRIGGSFAFSDAQHGWAIGGAVCYQATAFRTVISQGAFLWRTTNGGASWVAQTLPADVTGARQLLVVSPTQVRFISVTFNNGFYDNVIVETNDAGATFTVGHIPFSSLDLGFLDASHGIAVNATRPDVFTTSDGGATWSDISIIPDFQDPTGGILDVVYWRIDPVDGNDIWVSGTVLYSNPDAGFVSRSSDGGLTWTVQLLGDGT